jgi:acyl carrier protein
MDEDGARLAVLEVLDGIAPDVDARTLAPGADLREELDLDSMDVLNLVTGLHERTGVAIPDRDVPRLRSVEDVVAALLGGAG